MYLPSLSDLNQLKQDALAHEELSRQLFLESVDLHNEQVGLAILLQYNTIQYNTIQYNTIQYNTIQYNTIQYNTIQYNTIQYNTIPFYCPGLGNSFCSVRHKDIKYRSREV